MQGEAVLLERQYVFLVNRTNEYLRETMIMAPVPEQPDLSAALEDAYPYHYLRNPMNYLPVYTTQLANSIERLGALVTLLSTATSNDELKQRERQNRQIQIFVAIVAIAALLVALPQFFPSVDALSILKLFGYQTIYNSNTGIIALVMLSLALLGFLLWFCVWSFRRIRVYSRLKKERNLFRECVLKFWNLADYVTYKYEAEKRSKNGLPPFSPVLRPSPPSWFEKQWKSGWGADDIDGQATLILQELWSFFDSPSHASHSKKRRDWSDNWQQTSEDLIRQVRILSRLIHVFVLRPDLIPLARALCIMRFKSFQFLEKSTIGDNEFRDSLKYAGYSSHQVKSLQDWLYEPVNLKWIRDSENSNVSSRLSANVGS
jgi:hypothetical protein